MLLFSSVLKKLTAVSESLAHLLNKYSAIEKIIYYIETSRMRNLHLHIKEIFDFKPSHVSTVESSNNSN